MSKYGVESDYGMIVVEAPVTQFGPRGQSSYELAVANGFSGTLSEWLASLQGIDGIDGVGTSIKKFNFCPLTISDPQQSVFTAGDNSSVVNNVNGTLSSTNDNAPTINVGMPTPLAYAIATARATSGYIKVYPLPDASVTMLIMHDGSVNQASLNTIFADMSSLPANVGALFESYVFGSTTACFGVTQQTPSANQQVNGGYLTLSLSDGNIILNLIGTDDQGQTVVEQMVNEPFDSTKYSYLSLVQTATLTGATTVIGTLDFINTLMAQSIVETALPSNSADFDILLINGLGENGLPAKANYRGKSVQNDYWCVLYDNKTKIRVFRDYEQSFSAISSGLSITNSGVSAVSSGLGTANTAISSVSSGLSYIATSLSSISSSFSDISSGLNALNSGSAFSDSLWRSMDCFEVTNKNSSVLGQGLIEVSANSDDLNTASGGVTRISCPPDSTDQSGGVVGLLTTKIYGSLKQCAVFRALLQVGLVQYASANTQKIRIGLQDSLGITDSQTGVWFDLNGTTCIAKSANIANPPSFNEQSDPTILPAGWHFFDYVIDAANGTVRFVVWNRDSKAKLIDETLNVNLVVMGTCVTPCVVFYDEAGFSGWLPVNYIGAGATKPSFIDIPS